MLASFLGVLPILTPPLCALAFIMYHLIHVKYHLTIRLPEERIVEK
jgi:hypothetical protein